MGEWGDAVADGCRREALALGAAATGCILLLVRLVLAKLLTKAGKKHR